MKSKYWLVAALLAASCHGKLVCAQDAADAPPTIEVAADPLQKTQPLTRDELFRFARQISKAEKNLIPVQLDYLSALIRLRGVNFELNAAQEAELSGLVGGATGKKFNVVQQIRANHGGPRPEKNEVVEVRRGEKSEEARIVDIDEKGYIVEYLNTAPIDAGQQVRVAPELIWRIIPGEQIDALLMKGTPIQVQGTDAATKALRWYDAEIVDPVTNGYKVRVAGAGETTVRRRFLRRAVPLVARAAAATAAATPNNTLKFNRGQWVEIYWGAKWWKGRILAVDEEAGKYKVHYDGWGDNWDEWVTPEKVR